MRKVIVHIASSADGFIARPDGGLDWLTSRPVPEGFYGMNAFMKSIDTTVIGRKTCEVSLRMGAKFGGKGRAFVFSRQARPADAPAGVEFASGPIAPFVRRLKEQPGKDIPRRVTLELQSVERFEDGLVQLFYRVRGSA